MEQVKKSMPNMALDHVPMGDNENDYGANERVSKHLPPEVTSGMLYKDIVRIAWPSLIELLLTQLASMADMMMVGQLGTWATAAVGLTTQPKFLLMTLIMSLNVGATAMVARYKGAGQPDKANSILHQALSMTIILSLTASVLGYIFARPMVVFMGGTEEKVIQAAVSYLRIQMIGFLPFAITSTITAALRGAGNSRTAMIYNVTANVVNVVFNYLLIYGHFGFPRMEVAGASLATILGQLVACIYAVIFLLGRRQYLHISLKLSSYKPNRGDLNAIVQIGFPAMIEQLVMRAGMIIYSKTVASLGTDLYATHNICMNIQAMSFMLGQAFSVSATSLVGQSLGKRRPDMAQAYCSRSRRIGMIFSICLAICFILFAKNIIVLYNSNPIVVETGARILFIMAFIQPLQTSQFIVAGALRGAGDTRATAVITFITVLLVRPGIALLAIYVLNWGLEGAWIAMASDQLLRSIFVLLRYNSGKWKSIRIRSQEMSEEAVAADL